MIPSTTARSAILGVPLDSSKQPSGSGVVRAIEQLDARIIANSAGAIIKNSLANLNTAVSPAVGAMAWVIGDATVGNNGVYENTGTSVAPVWTRRADLPYGFIPAINVGSGTANAIQVTTSIPIPSADGAAEIMVPIVATNTSGTVTISINGATAVAVKTASGANPAIGALTVGMLAIGVISASGTEFRLYSNLSQYANFDHQGDWSAVVTYTENQVVTGSDGYWYQLKVASALNDNPVSGGSGDWLQILASTGVADGSVTTTKIADKAVTEPKIADAFALTMSPVVSDRTALKALDTSRYTTAFLAEDGRQGIWQWLSGDVSARVAPRTLTLSVRAVDTITMAANHRLKTGDAVVPVNTANGLTANTFYNVIRVNATDLKFATSRANALAGTAVTLSAGDAQTYDVVPDYLEGDVIVKSGAAKNGSAGAWLRMKADPGAYEAMHYGFEVGGSTDNAEVLNMVQHVAEEAGGGLVRLPAGDIYMVNTVYPRRYVFVEGAGKQATRLNWYTTTATIAVDGLDNWLDGAYPYDRTIFSYRKMTLSGLNTGGASTCMGVRLGVNHRSAPILSEMVLTQFPNHGIQFIDDNWNIDIVDVEIDTCGHSVSGASGIHKWPSVTDLNHVNFTRVRVEGCGNSGSLAGGWNCTTTSLSTNRGWQFTDCQAEGNFGSAECYFTNLRGLYFNGFYVECLNTGAHTVGMEFDNCTGLIHGAQLIAEAGTPVQAIKISNDASRFTIMAVDFGAEWTYIIDTYNASAVRYASLTGAASPRANDTSTITAM